MLRHVEGNARPPNPQPFSRKSADNLPVQPRPPLNTSSLPALLAHTRPRRQMSPAAAPSILSLPPPLLERIVALAAGSRRGKLPFGAWTVLPAVHPAFRAAFHASVTRVALCEAYGAPGGRYESLPAYASAAARLLAGPVLRCARLRALDLNGCDALTDDDVADFAARCPGLVALALTVCRGQTDASVVALARASPRLRRVDVGGCDRHRHSAALLASGGEDPDALREARWAATQRHEPCVSLTNSSMIALATFCPGLRSICLSNAPHVTDTALLAISALPELAVVVLRRLLSITDAGVRALVSGPGSFTSLSLFSNTSLGDEALRAVACGRATSESLAFFGMTFSYNVSDAGLAALVSSVPTLEELQVDHCGQVTDAWTASVLKGGGLTRVSLRNVGIMLTARGLCDLAESGTSAVRLMALNLGFVSTVDAEILRSLRKAAPLIKVLVLDACGGIDDEGAGVVGEFENLRILDVSWCSKITCVGISAICDGAAGPRLERLSIGPIPLPYEEAVEAGVDDPGGGEGDVGLQWPLAQWDLNEEDYVDAELGPDDNGAHADNAHAWEEEDDGEEEEPPAAPVLENFFGPDAADFANALDLVVHEEEDEEQPLAAAIQAEASRTSPEGRVEVVDATLYEVGRKCTGLRELVLSGSVNPQTLAWLQKNTGAKIDYLDMQSGVSSSIYDVDDEPGPDA